MKTNLVKKFAAIAMAALMTASCFTGCSNNSNTSSKSSSSTTASGATSGSSDKKWEIGGIGPTSGANASYGISVKQGAQLAVDEVNKAGGINGSQIDFKFEDDQADANQGVTAYNSLKDGGMKISLGCVTSGSCADVAVQAAADNMFLLTPSASNADCIKEDNAFRVCFDDPYQGTYLAKYIKENYDVKSLSIGVLYNSASDYSKGIYGAFTKELGSDIKVTAVAFTDDTQTVFTSEASSLSSCDLVFMPIYYQAAAAYLKAAQSKQKADVKYFGGDGLDGIISELGEGYKNLAEGIKLLTPFNASSTDKKIADFVTAYKAKYNAAPDQFAADGYDAIYAIKASLEAAKASGSDVSPASSIKDTCEALKKAITSITFEGATGKMTWDPSGAPTKAAAIVTITNGEYK